MHQFVIAVAISASAMFAQDVVAVEGSQGISAPKILEKTSPWYTDEALREQVQGTVLIDIVIEKNGMPGFIEVTRGVEPSLDEQTVVTVSQWRFEPPMKDGQPIRVRVSLEVAFKLSLGNPPKKVKRGIMPPRIEHTQEPDAKGEGVVVLTADIGTDGSASGIKIVRGIGPDLDRAAAESVSKWRFEPGTKNGKPVRMRTMIGVNFGAESGTQAGSATGPGDASGQVSRR